MSGDWRLRPGRFEDLRALAAPDARALASLEGDDPYSYGALRQLFDLFPDLLVVAEREGSLLGYAFGAIGSRQGWILGVAVEPGAQRVGVGRALTSGLLELMESRGVDDVSLTVHPDNAAALALYGRLGFEEEGSEPDYFGEGKPRVVLRRRG